MRCAGLLINTGGGTSTVKAASSSRFQSPNHSTGESEISHTRVPHPDDVVKYVRDNPTVTEQRQKKRDTRKKRPLEQAPEAAPDEQQDDDESCGCESHFNAPRKAGGGTNNPGLRVDGCLCCLCNHAFCRLLLPYKGMGEK
jgi:hypothetical protein